MKVVILLLALVAAVYGEKINYTGYRVYRVLPTNQHQIDLLRVLEQSGGYDFWTDATTIGRPVDIMVPPHMVNRFADALSFISAESELMIPNLQERIDNENPKYKPNLQGRADMSWDVYHNFDDLNAWIFKLADTYPNICSVVQVGHSYEGRPIYALRAVFQQSSIGNIAFMETGIHAREWIGPATLSCILNQWLTTTDPEIIRIRELYEWYWVFSFNPDGYVYTWTDDRMWRKTRTPYTPCVGADPNRNWAFAWDDPNGSSNITCSETYCGPTPFSEVSQKTISDFLKTLGNNITAYISLHSYSQLLLLPYGNSTAHLGNFDQLYSVGQSAIADLATYYGTQYVCGNTVEVLYVASGISVDWVKSSFGTPISYTFELRDTGTYGFILPADQIMPSCIETGSAIRTIFSLFNPAN